MEKCLNTSSLFPSETVGQISRHFHFSKHTFGSSTYSFCQISQKWEEAASKVGYKKKDKSQTECPIQPTVCSHVKGGLINRDPQQQ